MRGLASQRSAYEAVMKMCKTNLKINKPVEIEYAKKIYEKDQKMTVVVEFNSPSFVSEILKHTKNLKGTTIFIELDLCRKRLKNKKVMLQLKKEIVNVDESKKVRVQANN